MKRQIIFLALLLITSFISFSQIDSTKRINPANIRTQGDNERYWAQEVFYKKYQLQQFEKYKGTITTLNNNSFSYDGIIMITGYISDDYKIIFHKGIIYPAIFRGFNDGRILKLEQQPDSTRNTLSRIFDRIDSLGVGIMEEFEFLNPSPKVKRYKLYLSRPGFMNPSMYVIELTNENATKETNLGEFLNGAKLTFLQFISILI